MVRKEISVTPERLSLHETAEHYAWDAMAIFGIDGNNSVSRKQKGIEAAASDIPARVQRRSEMMLGRQITSAAWASTCGRTRKI